ncbi:MAG: biotin--[acetyl-CoA-carboxylase] ligase, partial [Pelagibacterales bacterium]|nr:biotin--[acetyl-CoA-carboxylase] ligase [Pelagibacterales bacterium]
LSVINTIEHYVSNDNYIKWPNDILSAQKKISGILIENNIKGDEFKNSIIGIGLNVNQTRFMNIANATSIKLITNKEIRIEEVLDKLINNIGAYIKILIAKDFDTILDLYNSRLYGRDYCKFLINNETFEGKVINVNPSGSINVKIKGLGTKEYESNRIKILL